jgi:hypothetical protein
VKGSGQELVHFQGDCSRYGIDLATITCACPAGQARRTEVSIGSAEALLACATEVLREIMHVDLVSALV